jgi:NitT/TauT family transport system permease protein
MSAQLSHSGSISRRPLLRKLEQGAAFMAPILVVLLLWEWAARAGLTGSHILPAPTAIVARGMALLSGADHHVLLVHTWHSLLRASAAFVLAVMVGVPLGFWLGRDERAYSWVRPWLALLLPLPAVAWTPIFLVTLGQGDVTIVAVCFLGAVFPVLISTIQGVRAIAPQNIWVVRSLGAGPLGVFLRVLIPASLPTLMAGFKLGFAHSWRTLVAAEMLAASSYGLGFMIFAAREYMDVRTMFVGIVLLAALGFAFEHLLFGSLEAVTVHRWYRRRQRH